MNNKEYSVRKMLNSEFKSHADLIRRDAAGSLCHFACEHSSGAVETGLSRAQAFELAERMNNLRMPELA